MPGDISKISQLPNSPAVYGLYAGKGRRIRPAYVGLAGRLRQRIKQHLISRDSTVTLETAPIRLNPEALTEVRWWTHLSFKRKRVLRAAELVAFEVLDPGLRSRGFPEGRALLLSKKKSFRQRMTALFRAKPSGKMPLHTSESLAEQVVDLELRVSSLEQKMRPIKRQNRH